MSILSRITAWIRARWQKSQAPLTEVIAAAELAQRKYAAEFDAAIKSSSQSYAAQLALSPQSTAPKGTPMAAIDLSPLASEFDAVSAYLAKLASGADSAVQLQAALDAEKKAHADTQAALDQANADAASSAQAVTAMAAKYAALVPAG